MNEIVLKKFYDKIPRLTLNERLSEIMGLRLAYDTLAFTRSYAEEPLPWISLRIDQLFYLAYAQVLFLTVRFILITVLLRDVFCQSSGDFSEEIRTLSTR